MRSSSIICLFASSGDRRALPSFPTRRSSDLGVRLTGVLLLLAAIAARADPEPYAESAPFVVNTSSPRLDTDGDGMPDDYERSEEHTSELQSQFHLVCRLLLEKKKKQPVPELH